MSHLAIVKPIAAGSELQAINALESRIVAAEDDADTKLWEQAALVAAALDSGMTQRQVAAGWINARTGEPYSAMHVNFVRQVLVKYTLQENRPRFRDAYNAVANPAKAADPLAVHYTSDTPEWYTPTHIVQAVVETLGDIDLDPCADPGKAIPASAHLTADDDGLAHQWRGRVFLNPPYGDAIGDWTAKLLRDYDSGALTEAVALVPARTDTQWFAPLFAHPICFISGRLRFGDAESGAPFPSACVYLGSDVPAFVHAFSTLGHIVGPIG